MTKSYESEKLTRLKSSERVMKSENLADMHINTL